MPPAEKFFIFDSIITLFRPFFFWDELGVGFSCLSNDKDHSDFQPLLSDGEMSLLGGYQTVYIRVDREVVGRNCRNY